MKWLPAVVCRGIVTENSLQACLSLEDKEPEVTGTRSLPVPKQFSPCSLSGSIVEYLMLNETWGMYYTRVEQGRALVEMLLMSRKEPDVCPGRACSAQRTSLTEQEL